MLPLFRFRLTEGGVPHGKAFRIFIIGDWGTGGKLQKRVANAMDAVASKLGAPLTIISTGDNIYPDGVSSARDTQWKTKFEDVYNGKHLAQAPWVAVLGNHDYRKSIMAQVEYGRINPRWIMPSTYFSHRLKADNETTVSVICLDTQQILQQSEGWRKQIDWLDVELSNHVNSDWIIAVGHHPIRSYGYYGDQEGLVKFVKPVLDKHRVHIYACGHDHDLQVIKNPADEFFCIVSGGGGGFRKTTRGQHTLANATNGGFVQIVFNSATTEALIMNADGETLHQVYLKETVLKR
jgi:hypothetical protein